MSFLKSIFNAVCDAGSELLETQQEYSDEFARVNDYQLKQAYRNAKAHPYQKGIMNGIARLSALEQECVGRGIIISSSDASQKQRYWKNRYEGINTRALKREHQALVYQYREYVRSDKNDDSLLNASILKPRITALEDILQEREQSV